MAVRSERVLSEREGLSRVLADDEVRALADLGCRIDVTTRAPEARGMGVRPAAERCGCCSTPVA